jgi:hypothetical protein
MLWAYTNRFLECVFRPRLTWRDVAAFVLGFMVPLGVWLAKEEAGEFAMSIVSSEFLAGVGVVLLLRLICAPYIIWRELIAYISELHQELDGRTH